jgi:hypothetical protein
MWQNWWPAVPKQKLLEDSLLSRSESCLAHSSTRK